MEGTENPNKSPFEKNFIWFCFIDLEENRVIRKNREKQDHAIIRMFRIVKMFQERHPIGVIGENGVIVLVYVVNNVMSGQIVLDKKAGQNPWHFQI